MTSSTEQLGLRSAVADEIIPAGGVESRIYLIRGQKVLLDRDLAELYGVETRVLNQAVCRNLDRFPKDFMFALTREEIRNLSQFVISSGFKHSPRVLVFKGEMGFHTLIKPALASPAAKPGSRKSKI